MTTSDNALKKFTIDTTFALSNELSINLAICKTLKLKIWYKRWWGWNKFIPLSIAFIYAMLSWDTEKLEDIVKQNTIKKNINTIKDCNILFFNNIFHNNIRIL